VEVRETLVEEETAGKRKMVRRMVCPLPSVWREVPVFVSTCSATSAMVLVSLYFRAPDNFQVQRVITPYF
jgi:hypothetical protein